MTRSTPTTAPATPAAPDRASRRGLTAAATLWILAGVVWLAGEAIAAAAFPGYDYATNYISDLGVPEVGTFQGREIDSPLHGVMNATFLLKGALFLAASVVAARVASAGPRRTIVTLASIHAAGLVLVGVIPGSQASAESGIGALHVLGAALAIIAGNLVAIVAGSSAHLLPVRRAVRIASVALGVVGLAALVMLQADSSSTTLNLLPDGVWERAAVYTVTAWELLVGAALLVGLRRAGR